MQKNRVYFTGTLPKKGQTPFGGGEVGNVRTVSMLELFGYEVRVIRRLRSNAKDSNLKRRITYPIRCVFNLLEWFVVLLIGRRKYSVAHISGFYGVTIPVETVQVFLAKLLGYKLIYEMRGGGATTYYLEGSATYKKQFRYIVGKADYIFSQGKENEPLLQELCSTPIFYYPNSVKSGFYLEDMPDKSDDIIRLLFYGRVESEKNPLLIVEVAAILQKRFQNIRLSIIGDGQPDYIEKVMTCMETKLKKDSYELLPGCEHDSLLPLIKDKHFYIFPSEQPREGQSNAITEAMSLGIIPIASPQGFSRSTIGDDNLIVEELSAKAYADRIASIIENGEIAKYSSFVRKRFLDNFTESVVFERARIMYSEIFESKHRRLEL